MKFSLSQAFTGNVVDITLTFSFNEHNQLCPNERLVPDMSNTDANTHLTLAEIRIILTGLTNGSAKTAIAQTIAKDKSAVGKENKLKASFPENCRVGTRSLSC